MADIPSTSSGRRVRLSGQQITRLFLSLPSSDSESSNDEDFQPPPKRRGKKRAYSSSSESENDVTSADATPTVSIARPVRPTNTLGWVWQNVETETETTNHFRFVNQSSCGLNNDLNLSHSSTPIEIFLSLLDDQLLTNLLTCINEYAQNYIVQKTPTAGKYSFVHSWRDIVMGEMYKFLAVITEMGMDPRPSIKDYWSTRGARYTPWFHDMFARQRFEAIFHTALHVGEAESTSKDKIEPFISKLIAKFQNAFYPFEEVSIDEMVVGFQGRFKSKQYNPTKPEKYHIKNYGLCDSRTGYVYNLLTYYGSDTSFLDISSTENASHAVCVMDTLITCLHKGHHIFADRYYTSTDLIKFLLDKQFNFTGTVDIRRKNFPPALKTIKLDHRQSVYFWSTAPVDCICVAWRDKKARKPCVLVSTKTTSNRNVTVTEGRQSVQKPEVIHEYNTFMNGCDKADQMVSYYGNHHRKTIKWWKKLFFWIIEVTQFNAHIIYTLLHADDTKKLSLKTFKEKLVDGFVSEAAARGVPPRAGPKTGVQVQNDSVDRVSGLHLVDFVGKDRDCVHCSTAQKRKRSSYVCTGCSSKPHLCPKECFKAYHLKALRL